MPIHNDDVAGCFETLADLLEIKGENAFRVRAYRNAALTLHNFSENVAQMAAREYDFSRLSGIGPDLSDKIYEIVNTGKLGILEELKKEVPEELRQLLHLTGLGPKRAHILYRELGIRSLAELQEAIDKGKLVRLPGMGKKTAAQIKNSLEMHLSSEKRFLWIEAEPVALDLKRYLEQVPGVTRVALAGSFRRHKETVGDLDMVACCSEKCDIMTAFTSYDDVAQVIEKGPTRSTVILRNMLQVDLRLVKEDCFGAALHSFSGSQAHVVALRKMAQMDNVKVNEYGIFKDGIMQPSATEEDIYRFFGMAYVAPELRENRGEIEAALENKLPVLVRLEEIKGDLHSHTNRTDGKNTLEEMARAAAERGYEYLAVTDHSKHASIAGGLTEEEVWEQIREIDALNKKLNGLTLLKGIEVDILADGSLDFSDALLKELDVVIASVHYKFNLPEEEQTERVLRALDNPYVTILGHPTGRLLNQRSGYAINLGRVLEKLRETGCFAEINSNPRRLDLDDIYSKKAKSMGIKLAISTDAHSVENLTNMRLGVAQGRRGWLSAEDVLNTRSLDELRPLLRSRR